MPLKAQYWIVLSLCGIVALAVALINPALLLIPLIAYALG